jgi:flagellar secretion chaperone FliS
MSVKANPVRAYRETRIKTASQGQIIVMLYEEAVKKVDAAIELIEDGGLQYDRVNDMIGKAQDIITELMASLDFEKGGELAQRLFGLYMYFNDRLRTSNFKKDTGPLKEIRPLLLDLKTAWQEIASQNAGPADKANGGVNIAG